MKTEKSGALAFNVSQLLKEGIGSSRERQLSGELYDIDEHNPGPVHVEGHVHLLVTPDGVLATGEARLKMTQVCRRCLELAEDLVTIEIEEEFVPKIDVVTGRPMPATDLDEPELIIDEHHTLDLSEVLYQYAVAQTLKPAYCEANCKGLCPVCGANWNVEQCACDTSRVDPRLASLAQLLEAPENE